jgi:predicted acetyltransferase
MSLELIEPIVGFEASYRDLIDDFGDEILIPFPLRYPHDDFPVLIQRLRKNAEGLDLDEGRVASSTFWLVENQADIIGVSNLRHEINDALKRIGGHIGYGVRPSRRREGHATEMLRLTLLEARKRRIERVLLTCDRENEPSVKTILNNGGQFDSEEYVDVHGGVIARYWISL